LLNKIRTANLLKSFLSGSHVVDNGVQMVGGCCGIGPENIQLLKETAFADQPFANQ